MSLIISEECIACDACVSECPVEAISADDPIYVIDSDRCVECISYYDDPICVEVCPSDCISLDKDNPESRQDLELKNKQIQMQQEND